MAARTFRLTNQALLDLDEIGVFLRERSPSAAIRVLDELAGTFKMLAANPEIGTKRDDLHAGLRMFSPSKPANNYVVFFFNHSTRRVNYRCDSCSPQLD